MRNARFDGHLYRGVCPGGVCPRRCLPTGCLLREGAYMGGAWPRGSLPMGKSARLVSVQWGGGVSAQGVCVSRGCTPTWIQRQTPPQIQRQTSPVSRMTDRWKNIIVPQPRLRVVKKVFVRIHKKYILSIAEITTHILIFGRYIRCLISWRASDDGGGRDVDVLWRSWINGDNPDHPQLR